MNDLSSPTLIDTPDILCCKAAERYLNEPLPAALLFTGDALLTHSAEYLWEDLEGWLLPGLAILRVESETLRLEPEMEILPIIQERIRREVEVPLFQFEILQAAEVTEGDEACKTAEAVQFGRLLRVKLAEEVGSTLKAGEFTHLLRLWKGRTAGARRIHTWELLRRIAAFSTACPNRFLQPVPEDLPNRTMLASWLQQAIGRKDEPEFIRLRRAADYITGDPEDFSYAVEMLREAVILHSKLPEISARPLLADPTRPLSGMERQSLIYMSRASIPELKCLALCRLASDPNSTESRQTLEVMSHSTHPWVRHAAILTPAK